MTMRTETFDTFLDLEPGTYTVVHPLHDAPEVKRSAEGLGPIQLSPACRNALIAVRCYLAAILLMGGYRVVTLLAALRR